MYLNVVISPDLQAEWSFERNLLFLDGLNIDFPDETIVGHHLVPVHNVYDWLGESNFPYGRHVKAIDVVPPVDLILLVLPVLKCWN